jgi:TRAP transporter 4TM/12TM fusion protein
MLNRFGAGHFFNEAAISLLGRFKGGPAKAAVVSSGLTGLVSGSSIANVVTTGTFTIPLMKKVGYPAETAAATEVAASTNGQLMPPIMGAAAFIIAEYLAIDYMGVVKAAILPASVSYIALFYITHLEASKLKMKGLPPSDIPDFIKVMRKGFYFLIPITVLIFELMYLRHTPNLAAFNAIIVLGATVLVKRIVEAISKGSSVQVAIFDTLRLFAAGMVSGAKNMIPVAIATATAGIIVGIVTTGIGSMLVQIVESISGGNMILLLFITAIASLILGMGLPTTATYIVMASITVPIIISLSAKFNMNPIPAIAAHLFCFYFGILADDTPPVGLAAYAAAAIAKADPVVTGIRGFLYDLRTAVIPFMFVFNPELLLCKVDSLWQALLIFVAASLGALAFSNVAQGWFIIKNKLWELPLFLAASLILFCPAFPAGIFKLGYENRYWMYILGLLLYFAAYLSQRLRIRRKMA